MRRFAQLSSPQGGSSAQLTSAQLSSPHLSSPHLPSPHLTAPLSNISQAVGQTEHTAQAQARDPIRFFACVLPSTLELFSLSTPFLTTLLSGGTRVEKRNRKEETNASYLHRRQPQYVAICHLHLSSTSKYHERQNGPPHHHPPTHPSSVTPFLRSLFLSFLLLVRR